MAPILATRALPRCKVIDSGDVLHEVANGHGQCGGRFGQQLQHSFGLPAQCIVCLVHEGEELAAAGQRPVLVMAVLGRLNIICRSKASLPDLPDG